MVDEFYRKTRLDIVPVFLEILLGLWNDDGHNSDKVFFAPDETPGAAAPKRVDGHQSHGRPGEALLPLSAGSGKDLLMNHLGKLRSR